MSLAENGQQYNGYLFECKYKKEAGTTETNLQLVWMQDVKKENVQYILCKVKDGTTWRK